jgi:hypothetical protein
MAAVTGFFVGGFLGIVFVVGALCHLLLREGDR